MSESMREVPTSSATAAPVVGRQTAISGTWTVGARLLSRVIDMGTMLVLARMLTPKDFGLVAIAMSVIYIVEASLELPLSEALVRLPTIDGPHYDTAFTLSLLRGMTLSLIVSAISWPFSVFYRDHRLFPLICLLSLAPAARGMVSPRIADLYRTIDFTVDFKMEFCGKLAAFLTAVTIAFATRSYWAVAAGTVISPVVSTVTSYLLRPYRPRLSFSQLHAFSGFLGWMSAAQLVSAMNWQSDRLLLGRLYSKTDLGLFTTANDISNIPGSALLTPILRPLLSAFSLLREEPRRLIDSYERSCVAIVTIGLPILVGENMLAYPLVRLLLGAKWLGSAALLRWLAISLIPALFALPLVPMVMAFGRTQIFFRRNLLEFGLKLPLMIAGAIKIGFLGVILARGISETITILYSMFVAKRLIGIGVLRQMIAPWRSVTAAAVMALVLSQATPPLTRSTHALPLALGSLTGVLLGAASYSVALAILWRCSGSPAGIEAMIHSRLSEILRRSPSVSVVQMSMD